jgi:hypothetical protein
VAIASVKKAKKIKNIVAIVSAKKKRKELEYCGNCKCEKRKENQNRCMFLFFLGFGMTQMNRNLLKKKKSLQRGWKKPRETYKRGE